MKKRQSQGAHHITIVGADRQTSIDFCEGVLGIPFVFEQLRSVAGLAVERSRTEEPLLTRRVIWPSTR